MVQFTYVQSSCSDQSERMIQLWPIRKHGSAFISWPIRRHGSNSHQHKCLSWSSHQQKYLTFQYKRRASLPSNILTHSSRGTHSPELNHPAIPSTYHITPIHPYISLLVRRKERTITLIHWCVLNQAFHKSLSYLYIRYPSWLKVKEGDIKPE